MNKHTAEMLEAHFDTAFAAPDGIKKLRELILTLAMQGRLVPQDPSDQPASELLNEIETEKKRLVKEGKIKEPKPLPPVTDEEMPYVLPQGWKWVRMASICSYIQRGKSPSYVVSSSHRVISQKCVRWYGLDLEPARYVDPKSLEKYEPIRYLCGGDLLWNSTGTGTIGRACLVPDDLDGTELVADSHVTVVRPLKINKRFLWRWIQSPLVQSGIENSASGTTNQIELNTSTVINHLIPLPSLTEQYRIVAKIDKLMARCDALEKLRAAQEEKRLAVHTAAIKQLLNIAESGDHQHAQAFLAENFSEIYTVKENVAELRKAILQLAVMGKLVPQAPNDPPASELLKEIDSEKKKLVKEGKIKVPKPLPPINSKEIPYALPEGWIWVRLQDLIIHGPTNGFSPKAVNYETNVRSLTLTATTSGKFKGEFYKFLDIDIPEDSALWLQDGDILVQRGNTIEYVGVSAIYSGKPKQYIYPDLMMKIRLSEAVDANYVHCAMNSEPCREYLRKNASGTSGTMPKISQGTLISMPIPLPPQQKQKMTIAKLSQLMSQCDHLEQQIDAAIGKQSKLLNSVMAQI